MSEAPSPTALLGHGAFADAASWNGAIERLQAQGVKVTAPANPPRGLASDSAYIAATNGPQEAPQAFADAILEVGRGVT